VKDEDLEKGVHEEDPVRLDGRGVEEDRFWRPIEGVGVQDRLNHDQTLRQIFPEKASPGK